MSGVPQDQPAITEPFPGPRPFAASEYALFKGREKESRDVRDLLLSYQVVILYAKSGAGKSSLVNAGLRPLLIEEGFETLPVVRVGGKIPPQIDHSKVRNIFVFNVISSCAGKTTDPAPLLDAELSQYLGQACEKPRVLVLDQFEELFTTFPERWEDRKPFFSELQKACQSNKDLRLLMVIREDHLAELDTYADFLPNNLRIRYRLERLREAEALEAVVLPIHLAGYAFEEGVAEELVTNLRRTHVQTEEGTTEVTGEFVEPVHLRKRVAWAFAAGLLLVALNYGAYRYARYRADKLRAADADQAQDEMNKGRNKAQERHWDEALAHYKAALQLFDRLRDRPSQAEAYSRIGSVYFDRNRYPAAVAAYKEALKIDKDRKDDVAVAAVLPDLADALRWTDEYADAENCLKESLALYSKLPTRQPKGEPLAKAALAALYSDRGDYSAAASLLSTLPDAFFQNHDDLSAFTATANLGGTLTAMGQRAKGFKMYEKALEGFWTIHSTLGRGDVLAKLGRWYVEGHLCVKGIELSTQALEIAEEKNDTGLAIKAREVRARAYLCVKSLGRAAADAQQALLGIRDTGDRWSEAYNLETLALIGEAKGDRKSAIENGQKAVELYDSMGNHTVYAKAARGNLTRWQRAAGHEQAGNTSAKRPSN